MSKVNSGTPLRQQRVRLRVVHWFAFDLNRYPESMRNVAALLAAVVLCTTLLSARGSDPIGPVAQSARPAIMRHLDGVIIVKLRAGLPNTRSTLGFGIPALDTVLDRLGIESRRPMFPLAPYPAAMYKGSSGGKGYERVYVLNVDPTQDVYRAISDVAATGTVDYAEPYYIFDLYYTPNDPLLNQQYGLNLIKARQAWDVTKGDRSVAIAICDAGVDLAHDDLAPNIWTNMGEAGIDGNGDERRSNGVDDDRNGFTDDWHGWDFVGNPITLQDVQSRRWIPDNNPTPRRVEIAGYQGYHGTWVAGAAAASTDNGVGIAGAGFNTSILPLKCTADSLGTNGILAGYDAIRYAADLRTKVINCSFGGTAPEQFVQSLQDVVDYAVERGCLVVAASGNDGTNNDRLPHYPANLRHVLSVGASGSDDLPAGFSGYGVSVDLYAPGVGITTTNLGGGYVSSNVTGTSFSAPMTAGIAALVIAQHPDWTPDQVAMQLRSTGDRLTVSDPRIAPLFFRRLNAERAVTVNRDLASGASTNRPGVGMISYSVVPESDDTLHDFNDSVRLRLRLRNYLAPTRELRVEAHRNGELTADGPVAVGAIGTLAEREVEITARLDPDAQVIYAEGELQLVLRLVDGDYEDYVAVLIPVSLPGWRQQVDPLAATTSVAYVGSGIDAVTPRIAWAVGNVPAGQGVQIPFFSRNVFGTSWSTFSQIVAGGSPSQEALYTIHGFDASTAWTGSGPTGGQAGIFRTTNGGSRWDRAGVAAITPFVNGIHFWDKSNGIFIGDQLNGNWGIGRTTDGGATWDPLSRPVRAMNAQEVGWNNGFTVFGDTVWFGTNQSRIWRSTDRGETWTSHATPSLNSFGIAFANGRDGMATFHPLEGGAGTNMVAASRDGGISWNAIPLPFPEAEPQGVSAVPGTTRFFVATQRGVFETSDFGGRWKQMAMPIMQFVGIVLSTAADSSTGELASFGTNGFSQIMRYFERMPEPGDTTITDTSATDAPIAITGARSIALLREILPNPIAGGDAFVMFALHRAGRARLTIVDVNGRTVRVLHDGELEAGEHRARIASNGLAAGAYLLRLETGGTAVMRRVIVLQ